MTDERDSTPGFEERETPQPIEPSAESSKQEPMLIKIVSSRIEGGLRWAGTFIIMIGALASLYTLYLTKENETMTARALDDAKKTQEEIQETVDLVMTLASPIREQFKFENSDRFAKFRRQDDQVQFLIILKKKPLKDTVEVDIPYSSQGPGDIGFFFENTITVVITNHLYETVRTAGLNVKYCADLDKNQTNNVTDIVHLPDGFRLEASTHTRYFTLTGGMTPIR